MTADHRERFQYSYENDASVNYLVVKADIREKIQQFQVEMIAHNPSAGILPLDVRQKDDTLCFYYNITSRQALGRLSDERKLLRKELLGILSRMTAIVLESKNYLLYDKNFVLDENYIFIDLPSLEVFLVYLPVAAEKGSPKDFQSFILKLATETVTAEEAGSDNFLQRIISCAGSDTFNLIDFGKLLSELQRGQNFRAGSVPSALPESNEPVRKSLSLPGTVEDISPPGQVLTHPGIPPIPPPRQQESLADRQKKAGPGADKPPVAKVIKYKTSSMVIAAASQAAILAGIAGSWGLLKTAGDDIVTTCAGLGIAVLGADYFLFKYLFGENNRVEVTPTQEKKGKTKKPLWSNAAGKEGQGKKDRGERLIDLDGGRAEKAGHFTGETFRTPAYLQGLQEGTFEKIPITKPDFFIGRMREKVDFISTNNTVGKLHAEILYREGMYCLKDLNSRNGTFINGVRLDSNREYALSSNDRVRFANSDYRFIIGG